MKKASPKTFIISGSYLGCLFRCFLTGRFPKGNALWRVKGSALEDDMSSRIGAMWLPMQVPGISHMWNIALFLRYVSNNDSNPARVPHVRDAAPAMRN
ncbi:hypothetical protein LDL36_13145 [Komagataeibacter sp. FNDCR1]|nr:hypothetical protein [Komagataeibacter sp. FNDCR1]